MSGDVGLRSRLSILCTASKSRARSNLRIRKFDLARDFDAVHKIDSLDLSPTSPDIKAFVARGGKLLIYQGWGDMNVAPKSTVAYYDNVVKTIGQKQVDESVRLFFATL